MTTLSIRSRVTRLLLALAVCAPVATAQKPDKPKPDKEVADRIEVLEDVLGDKKFTRDAEGIAAIDVLYQKHEAGLCEEDDADIVKVLSKVLLKGKVRPADKIALYDAAAHALSQQGEAGADVLQKAYDNKGRFKAKPEWVPLREKLLRAIGKTKDESKIKFLLDEARRSPEAALQAAAGEALGNFEGSKEKVRKEIVGDLLVRYGSMSEKANQIGSNIESQNARDRLAALSGKWNETLKKLTGQDFDTFLEWQKWHNDNKNKDWQ